MSLKKVLFLGFIYCFLVQNIWAQESHEKTMEATRVAIGSGSTTELSKFFDSNFELSIKGKEYNKNQSSSALRAFFQNNPPQGFSLIHQGASDDESLKYSIGQYQSDGKSYRVLLRFKTSEMGSELYKLEFREIEKE